MHCNFFFFFRNNDLYPSLSTTQCSGQRNICCVTKGTFCRTTVAACSRARSRWWYLCRLVQCCGAKGLQSQRVSRFLHQAATCLWCQRASRSLTEGVPHVGTDSSCPPTPPLRCAEIHPNRTRSSLHNDPNESRFTGLDYFKQFAERAFWQQISPSQRVMVIPWLLLTWQKQCVDLDFAFSRPSRPHSLCGGICHSGGEANFSQTVLDDVSGRQEKTELTSRAPRCYVALDLVIR